MKLKWAKCQRHFHNGDTDTNMHPKGSSVTVASIFLALIMHVSIASTTS